MRTYLFDFERADETTVCCEYSITPYDPGVSWGPAESCYPPEGGEVEILKVTDADGNEVKLTDEEDEWACQRIAETHDHDSSDDWED